MLRCHFTPVRCYHQENDSNQCWPGCVCVHVCMCVCVCVYICVSMCLYTVGGKVTQCNHYRNQYGESSNNYDPITPLGINQKECEAAHNRHLPSHVCSSTSQTAQLWSQPTNRWMNKNHVAYVYNGVLLSHKEWNYAACCKMDGTGDHHIEWDKQDSERDISHFFFLICSI
jgi:hypothetical protein